MSRFHCLACGDLEDCNPQAWIHAARSCEGHVIPIATICNPPEPTVIDASDLAPGMVVVAVDDDPLPLCAFVCTPDARLTSYGSVWALRMDLDDAAWVAEGSDP